MNKNLRVLKFRYSFICQGTRPETAKGPFRSSRYPAKCLARDTTIELAGLSPH